jgi:hypothetical protein
VATFQNVNDKSIALLRFHVRHHSHLERAGVTDSLSEVWSSICRSRNANQVNRVGKFSAATLECTDISSLPG